MKNNWWELARQHWDCDDACTFYFSTLSCGCQYYDVRGSLLKFRTRFYTKHRYRGFQFRRLEIHFVHSNGIVKYGDVDDGDFSDDVGPRLHVSDVIAVKTLRPLVSALFDCFRWHWMRQLRGSSSLCLALPFLALRRFRCCSQGVRRALTPGKSDAAWVRACMKRRVASNAIRISEKKEYSFAWNMSFATNMMLLGWTRATREFAAPGDGIIATALNTDANMLTGLEAPTTHNLEQIGLKARSIDAGSSMRHVGRGFGLLSMMDGGRLYTPGDAMRMAFITSLLSWRRLLSQTLFCYVRIKSAPDDTFAKTKCALRVYYTSPSLAAIGREREIPPDISAYAAPGRQMPGCVDAIDKRTRNGFAPQRSGEHGHRQCYNSSRAPPGDMPGRPDTYMYEHFLSALKCHRAYRVCKNCWLGREEEIPLDLSRFSAPGQQAPGAVDERGHLSTGSMLKHAQAHGLCNPKVTGRQHDDGDAFDEDATRDWVYYHVLKDLEPITAVRRPCHRTWMRTKTTNLGGRKVARRLVKEFHARGKDLLKRTVQTALDQKCRITIGTDAWSRGA